MDKRRPRFEEAMRARAQGLLDNDSQFDIATRRGYRSSEAIACQGEGDC
jgi:hypothetical protein